MKRNKVLFVLLPLLISSLSGCTRIFRYNGIFDYADKDGYVYSIQMVDQEIGASLKSVPSGIKEVVMPDEVNGTPVVGIEHGASFPDVETLIVGRNVKRIGYYYSNNYEENNEIRWDNFYCDYSDSKYSACYWSNLKSVSFANSKMVTIPEGCFANCTKLESVTFNSDLQYIESGAFYGCKKLKNPTIPKDLRIIGNDAFASCPLIDETLKLPNNLIGLGSAFRDTAIVTSYDEKQTYDVVLSTYDGKKCLILEGKDNNSYGYTNEDVVYNYRVIGSRAISGVYTYEKNITFNSYTISKYAINGIRCNTLTLNGTEYIGEDAFNYNASIANINIKADVKYIGEDAFDEEDLQTISISDTHPAQKYIVYDNALYEKSDKDGYNLLMVPLKNPNSTLTLAPQMTGVRNFTNSYSTTIKKVYDVINVYDNNLIGIFGSSYGDEYIGDLRWEKGCFLRLATKEYKLIGNSETYKIINGSIYKDFTLVRCPTNREVETYTVSSSCETIAQYSFAYAKAINIVKLSRQVKRIEGSAFYEFSTTDTAFSIYIPKEVETITGTIFNGYQLNKTTYDEYRGDYYEYIDRDAKPIVYVESSSMKENWAPECFEGCEVVWGHSFNY